MGSEKESLQGEQVMLTMFAIGRHYFYVYYDEEQYFHDLHGLSYRGESVKKKFIELKCGTHLRKMHRKIMEALGLDRESHKISIMYRAPQLLHGSGVEAPHLLLLDVQPSFADATPLPYNNQPCSAIDDVDETEVLGATHTHDMGGSSHTYEHVQADMDRGIDIDTSRDVYKEFIDIDGLVDDAEVLDVPLIENNEKDCPTTVPIPEWFTSNTWDNIKDPSPALGTGHLTSWHKGEHPAIGMLFKSKASVHKKHGLWQISKCTASHNCSSLQVATDGQIMDSKFISIALEKYVREDLTRKFLAALSDADPDTVTMLKCDPRVPRTCIFNPAFWAFRPCIRGFRHCRPVISIDAMHLYGKYKGKLLIAMATDGNNEVYPLTFAVVESESTETWGWFLACLLTYVTDRTNLCIISDRIMGYNHASMTPLGATCNRP
ncbi:uncharacterized protein LOC136061944 [Quercus suber]|uniref:uncharacterized protein LOC136061944 n=1 Tax=Quercus suber TaxID=58331 RepID=UPI0032E00403